MAKERDMFVLLVHAEGESRIRGDRELVGDVNRSESIIGENLEVVCKLIEQASNSLPFEACSCSADDLVGGTRARVDVFVHRAGAETASKRDPPTAAHVHVIDQVEQSRRCRRTTMSGPSIAVAEHSLFEVV